MVKQGRFREDLFYRLRVFLIRTPALREHAEDIPLLAEHLWGGIANESGKKKLGSEVLEKLKHYAWPGNARELESTLDTLNAWFDDEVIDTQHLDVVMRFLGQYSAQPTRSPEQDPVDSHRIECLRHLRRADEVMQTARVTIRQFLLDKKRTKTNVRSAREDLLERYAELDKLCSRSIMFYSPATYEIVNHFKGRLSYFLELLDVNVKEAVAFCEEQIEPQFSDLTRAILDEVQSLLRDYDTNRQHGPLKWSMPGQTSDI
jgi:hypothetical protein